jgi:hypothetical protein
MYGMSRMECNYRGCRIRYVRMRAKLMFKDVKSRIGIVGWILDRTRVLINQMNIEHRGQGSICSRFQRFREAQTRCFFEHRYRFSTRRIVCMDCPCPILQTDHTETVNAALRVGS